MCGSEYVVKDLCNGNVRSFKTLRAIASEYKLKNLELINHVRNGKLLVVKEHELVVSMIVREVA